jgi:2-amino-4-hydroxy-6-hydroxymethyldihydropteridine diphosphokinase
MVPIAIALGSNLGHRERYLHDAAARLRRIVTDLRLSSLIDTEPHGVVGPQPRFLNAAAVGSTTLSAAALLEAMLAIERECGRERPYPGAPRTVDLDLIFYGDEVVEEAALTVPHPRFRERLFVLEPLAEIAPDWVDPITRQTVAELLRQARASA